MKYATPAEAGPVMPKVFGFRDLPAGSRLQFYDFLLQLLDPTFQQSFTL